MDHILFEHSLSLVRVDEKNTNHQTQSTQIYNYIFKYFGVGGFGPVTSP